MHDTGRFDRQVADVIGIVEREPVARAVATADGFLEIGLLILRAGRIHVFPHRGISPKQLQILREEADRAAVCGPDRHWTPRGSDFSVGVRVQSESSASNAARSASVVGGASLARLFHARS